MLVYENDLFLECFHENSPLVIMARGLGIDRLIVNLLRLYCEPGVLVLVLNCSPSDQAYYIEELIKIGVTNLPKTITTEYSIKDRQTIYLQGGVLFITSRILVVDMLTERLPHDLVTGIVVTKAHRVLTFCQEAFILRMFRQKNKAGFIKSVTDRPEHFTGTINQLERAVKQLFAKKIYIYPRFQAHVHEALTKKAPRVLEYHVAMTPDMAVLQTCILDIVKVCISEVKQSFTLFEEDELCVENAIGQSLSSTIRRQLEPVWHQVSPKTRSLVGDIKVLQDVLERLTKYDCVSFYRTVTSLKRTSDWLFLHAAETLFTYAKQRVFGPERKAKKLKADYDGSHLRLEENPKWQVVKDILEGIKEKQAKDKESRGRVLIAANDDQTCWQIKEFLVRGGRQMMERIYSQGEADESRKFEMARNAVPPKRRTTTKPRTSSSRSDIDDGIEGKAVDKMVDIGEDVLERSIMESIIIEEEDVYKSKFKDDLVSSKDAYFGFLQEPITVIHPLRGGDDSFGLLKTLTETSPRYVILLDAMVSFVRQLEVFSAEDNELTVYFVIYKDSCEEQRYLTDIRKEKQAFDRLVKEKASLAIPEEWPVDNFVRRQEVDFRIAGGQTSISTTPRILVDMREFRSELPSLIHRRGIQIEPLTLEVGDYILTDEICVERKSVSDLIQSLQSGRLYHQAAAMCRAYAKPMLLIEFDLKKQFSLPGVNQDSISQSDTQSRLALLTIHFPKLKLLWCQSPHSTVEIFEELKQGRCEPDTDKALSVRAEGREVTSSDDRYNSEPQDIVLRLPGITTKNYRNILDRADNLRQLSGKSEEQLNELLSNSILARNLHKFFHQNPLPDS